MSTYFAISDGNFSDSTVFAGTVSAADRTDSVASIQINQSTLNTAPFEANARDSIYGVALHLSARDVSSTGILTLDLQSANGIHVTENYPISSFTSYDGSNNLLTLHPQNWQLLQLTTPIAVGSLDTFTISLSSSVNNQISFIGSAGGFNPAKRTSILVGTEPGFFTQLTPFTTGIPELSFDLRSANSNWIYHPYSSDFGFSSSENFTVEGYFYFKTLTPTCHSILQFGKGWNGGGWSSAWGIHYRTDNQNIYFYRYYEGVRQAYYNCVAPLTTGRWFHIAITRENGVLGIWLDGSLIGIQDNNTEDYSGLPAPYDQLQIGYGASCNVEQYEDMYVSNVRITKSAVYAIASASVIAPLSSVNNTAFLYNNTSIHKYTTSDSANSITSKEFNLKAQYYNAIGNYNLTQYGTADRTLSTITPFNTANTYSHYFDGATYVSNTASKGTVPSSFKIINAVTGQQLDSNTTVVSTIDGKLCADFNGATTTRYIEVPGSNLAFGTGDFTIECFIYPRAHTAAYPCIFRTIPNNTSNNNILIFAGHTSLNTSKYQLATAGSTPYISSTSDIIYNAWTHIAAVRRSGVLYLYVNGVQEASMPYATSVTSTTDWHIGSDGTQSNFMFNGGIADFKITKSALYSASTEPVPTYPLSVDIDTEFLIQSVAATSNTFALTLDAWIQIPSSTSAANRTIAFTDSTDGWQLYITPSGSLNFKNFKDSSIITGTKILQPNTWYFIAVVGQAGEYKMYIDGVQEGATYTGAINLLSRFITIGAKSSTEYLTGHIYDFRVIDGTAVTPVTVPITQRAVSDCPLSTGYYSTNITGPISDTASPAGLDGSIRFNGTSDKLSIADSSALDMGASDFTIEFWVLIISYPTSGKAAFFAKRASTSAFTGYSLVIGTTGNLQWFIASSTGSGAWLLGDNVHPGYIMSKNTWHHVALVRNGNTITAYLDGTATSNGTATYNATMFADNSNLTIGAGAVAGGQYFNGLISNFRIVKGTAVYTSNFTAPTSPLANIPGTSYLLQSPYGSSGGIAGPATTGETDSLSFNGTTQYIETEQSLPMVYGDTTVEFWFNRATDTTSREFLLDLRSGTGPCFIDINMYGDKHIVFFENNGNYGQSISKQPVTPNVWHHVAVQRKNDVIYTYYDGVLTNCIASSSDGWFGNVITIGRYKGVNFYFNGYISNLRISSVARYSTPTITLPGHLTPDADTLFLASAPYNGEYKFGSTLLHAFSPITGKMTLPLTIDTPFADGISDSLFYGGASTEGTVLPASDNYKIGAGQTPFTIEFWIYIIANDTSRYLVIGNNTGGDAWGNMSIVVFAQSNIFYLQAHTTSGYAHTVTHQITPSTRVDKWTHFVAQYDGRYTRLFVNGVPSTTRMDVGDTGSYQSNLYSGKLCIGRSLDGSAYKINGLVSNFRIVNGSTIYPDIGFIPPASKLDNVAGTVLLAQDPYTAPFSSKLLIPPAPPTSTNTNDMLFFNGSTYLTTADPLSAIPGDVTIEFWVYPLRISIQEYYFDARGGAVADSWAVGRLTDDTLRLCYMPQDTRVGVVAANIWHYVNITRKNSIVYISIDGQTVSVSSGSTSDLGSNILYIGRIIDGYYMQGYMSNIRIVKDSALNIPEFTPSDSALTVLPETTFLSKTGADLDKYVVSTEVRALTAVDPISLNTNTYTPLISASNTSIADPGFFKFGVNNWMTFDHHVDFNLRNIDYTLEAWVYISNAENSGENASDGNFKLFTKMSTCTRVSGDFQFFVNTSNKVCVWYGDEGVTRTSNATAPTNQWFHIALVGHSDISGNWIKIYINGELRDTFTTVIFANNTSVFNIGTDGCGNYGYGYISNARIIKGVQQYTSNFTPDKNLTDTPETVLLVQSPYNVFNNKTYTAFRADATSVTNSNTGSPAYTFNGSNSFIRIHPDPLFNDIYGKEFTFEAWIKPTGTGGNRVILARRFGSPYYISWYLYIDANNLLHNHNYYSNQANLTPIPNDVWTHIALVCDKTYIYLFINGAYNYRFDNLPTQHDMLYYYPITIGYGAYAAEYFEGSISDIRLVTDQMMYSLQTDPAVPTIPLGLDSLGTTSLLFTDPYNNPDRVYQTSSGSVAFIVDSTFNSDTIPQSIPAADTPFVDGSGNPVGNSVYFYGDLESKNTYMRSVELPAMGLNVDSGEFTVEFWFKDTRTTSTQQCLFDNRQVGSWNLLIDLNSIRARSVRARLNNIDIVSNTNSYVLNTWNHVAVVRFARNTFALYINGILSASATVAVSPTTAQIAAAEMWIGQYNNSQGYYFRGYMSNIRIVKNRAVYTTAFALPTTAPADVAGKTPLLITSPLYNPPKTYSYYSPSSNTLISGSPFTSVGVDGPLSFVHDQIIVPYNQELNLYGVEWTIETWIYPYLPNGFWRCICIKKTTTGGQWRSYSLYLSPSNNTLHFGIYNGGQADAIAPLSTELYPNVWHHVALVCDGAATKLYINGKLSHTYSFAPTADNSNQPLKIGREDGNTGAASFEGYLSNFRIVRGKQLYTGDFTPPATPLDAIPYTSLLLKNPYTPPSYIAYATPTNIHISSSLIGNAVVPITVNITQDQIINNIWVHNKATLNMPINNNITLDVLGLSGMQITSEGTLNIT